MPHGGSRWWPGTRRPCARTCSAGCHRDAAAGLVADEAMDAAGNPGRISARASWFALRHGPVARGLRGGAVSKGARCARWPRCRPNARGGGSISWPWCPGPLRRAPPAGASILSATAASFRGGSRDGSSPQGLGALDAAADFGGRELPNSPAMRWADITSAKASGQRRVSDPSAYPPAGSPVHRPARLPAMTVEPFRAATGSVSSRRNESK